MTGTKSFRRIPPWRSRSRRFPGLCATPVFLALGCLASGLFAQETTNQSSATAPYRSWVSSPFLSTPAPASSSVPAYQHPATTYQPAPTTVPTPSPAVADPAFHQELTFEPPTPVAVNLALPDLANLVLTVAPDQSSELAAHLLVVFNSNDPDSVILARYYAEKRNIAPDHVLGIACPLTEEISRAQFQETLWQPINSYLVEKRWINRRVQAFHVNGRTMAVNAADRNEIWAIVLIRGVPLKIAPDPTDTATLQAEPQLSTNAAAVDSELAILPLIGLPKGGYLQNPLFDMQSLHPLRVGYEAARSVIMVTRLDGPRPEDVRRMIDDSLFAEKNRLAGMAVIDSRGKTDVKDGYTLGDSWLRHANVLLTVTGWPVRFDDREDLIPATDPINHVALYLGWYTADAMGPWVTPPSRFVRGAVAYHLHSFSANTVRSDTANWVGPLIAHGAAATMGTVYEPYLDLTPHLDIFTHHLLAGQPFAVCAYSSIRGVSWMVTVVGDPLYRPFQLPLPEAIAAAKEAGPDMAMHYDWLLLQQLRGELATGRISGRPQDVEKQIDVEAESGVAQEGLGDMLKRLEDPEVGPMVEQAYRHALNLDSEPIDQVRVGLKLAQYYSSHAEDDLAQTELRQLRELHPTEADRFGVANPLVPTNAPSSPPTPAPAPVLPQVPKPPGPPQPH